MVVQPPSDDLAIDRLVRTDAQSASIAQKTRRSSRLVRGMRLLLPVAALSLVAVMVIWTDKKEIIQAVPKESVAPQAVGQNELINPKFQSEDSHNQPYTITATKAYQKAGNLDSILLDKPVADMALKNGSSVAVEAGEGTYNQKASELLLKGDVQMRHNSGYEIRTNQMSINVVSQSMSSDQEVSGHGPAADIEAKGLVADGASDMVIFKGPAKLTLRQAPSPTSEAAPAPAQERTPQ